MRLPCQCGDFMIRETSYTSPSNARIVVYALSPGRTIPVRTQDGRRLWPHGYRTLAEAIDAAVALSTPASLRAYPPELVDVLGA